MALTIASLFLLVIPFARAFSWYFERPPLQCGNISIVITGNDAKPPYSVLIVPFEPTPLSTGSGAERKIMDITSSGNQDVVEFQLGYPATSQFVVVVSDSTRFASGGTSAAAIVLHSDDTSCLTPPKPSTASQTFSFTVNPPDQIEQCQNTTMSWSSDVDGTATFLGVIPGGQSFLILNSTMPGISKNGRRSVGAASWKPPIRAGTTLILVGGVDFVNGTADSKVLRVSAGANPDESCLSDSSPSSTPGTPVGGTYPTDGGKTANSNLEPGITVAILLSALVFIVATIVLLCCFGRIRNRLKYGKGPPAYSVSPENGNIQDPGQPTSEDLPEYSRTVLEGHLPYEGLRALDMNELAFPATIHTREPTSDNGFVEVPPNSRV